MKMIRLVFLLLLSALCFVRCTNDHTIYVAPGSSGSPDGSRNNPFSDIHEAISKAMSVRSADTVYIRLLPGIYYLDRTIVIDRNPASPLVIQGDVGHTSIISGAIPLSFEKGDPGWKTFIPQVSRYGFKVEQLYVNDERAVRAKSPDKGYFYIGGSSETVHFRGGERAPRYGTQRFEVGKGCLEELKGMPEEEYSDVMAMFYHNWDNTRQYLSHVEPDSGCIFLNGKGLKPWNPITRGSRFILENYSAALSEPGEWFCDRKGELSYLPREGEVLEQAVAYVPVLSQLLKIEGSEGDPVSNIVLRDLSFQHAAYVMPKTGNEPCQAAADIDAAIRLDFAKNITLENCEVKHTGNYGIAFNRACEGCRLVHSYLYDLGAGGVKIGESEKYVTRNITVENNIIQKTGNVFPCGVGVVIFHSSDNRVLHNEISNLLYSAVSLGWVWGYGPSCAVNNEVAYNHIHHIGWGELSDMGAVYTLGKSPGTRIHNNVIHDVYSYDYGGWGLYTDEGSSGIVLDSNLVYACKSGGFHQHYGKDNVIKNNIFAFGHYFQLQFTRVEEHRSFSFANNIVLMDCGDLLQGPWNKADIDLHDNCFWDLQEGDNCGKNDADNKWLRQGSRHNLFADPHFTDPYRGDFSFRDRETADKIGFVPFDFQNAGVVGEAWKKKALLSDEDLARFRNIILEREKNCSGYYRH